jgi:hypothetical protein
MVIIIQNQIRYFELYSNVYFYLEKPNHLFLKNLHTSDTLNTCCNMNPFFSFDLFGFIYQNVSNS